MSIKKGIYSEYYYMRNVMEAVFSMHLLDYKCDRSNRYECRERGDALVHVAEHKRKTVTINST